MRISSPYPPASGSKRSASDSDTQDDSEAAGCPEELDTAPSGKPAAMGTGRDSTQQYTLERQGSWPARIAHHVIGMEKAQSDEETGTMIIATSTATANSTATAITTSTMPPQGSKRPRTSASRLAQATPDVCSDYPIPAFKVPKKISHFPSEKLSPFDDSSAATVLYLAYGSNMAASTFEGQRGIRPLSSISVSAPSLELTFDLPGLPYREPCFANTAVRRRLPKIPGKLPPVPPVPVPTPPNAGLPNPPAAAAAAITAAAYTNSHSDRVWDGGLYGVVYEVTRADYAHIIATEGGGASYQEVLVPCLELPPRISIPEKPLLPEPPRPFLAHTLWAPQLPGGDDDDDGDDGDNGNSNNDDGKTDDDDDDDDDDKTLPAWLARCWRRLRARLLRLAVRHARPDPEYAQASPRYLALLIDGARENELPPAYQDWLASLAPYRATTCRQRLAAALLLVAGLPILLLMGVLTLRRRWRRPDQSDGRLPFWLVVAMGLAARALWWTYDNVLKPVFGDGERTQESEDTDGTTRMETATGRHRRWSVEDEDETAPLRGQEVV